MQNILIHKDNTIIQALDKLNAIRDVSRLILFVYDDNNIVIGSLTDGDVRRSLVKDKDINRKVGKICNRDFVFEYDKKDFLDLKPLRKKNIKILPILDQQKRLLRIVDLEKMKTILPIECVIMAGGRGKRLSPLTDTIPKPMMLLDGKPIIEHNIDKLISFGIKKIYISVKYLGQQIVDYLGDGKAKGIEIEYIWEDEPLGTAGALSLVNYFNTDCILLMNSDLFSDVNFEELYTQLIQKNADMVVATIPYSVDIPYAIMELDNDLITSFKEKPKFTYHANAGIYLFKREMINLIPKNIFYNATDWIDSIISTNGKLIHSPITGYWIDIGKPADYNKAKEIVKHMGS
ncbi:nucleotidyltransferase family protein [Flavobacteriaceae bacterium]|nr:nucleotidyltransferase family protein [Flavobacteriaceae bacterium]